MEIPAHFLTTEHIARLHSQAVAILRGLGVDDLFRVQGASEKRLELLSAADDVVQAMLFRLLKDPQPPPPAAAWEAFFYVALRNDALDYRGRRLNEKDWSSLNQLSSAGIQNGDDEGPKFSDRYQASADSDPTGQLLLEQITTAVSPAVRKLIEEGLVTPGEKAEDFVRLVTAYLGAPEEKFDSLRQQLIGDKPDGLSKSTANRWWIHLRRRLADQFEPDLHRGSGSYKK